MGERRITLTTKTSRKSYLLFKWDKTEYSSSWGGF